jgi:hypothetical protein
MTTSPLRTWSIPVQVVLNHRGEQPSDKESASVSGVFMRGNDPTHFRYGVSDFVEVSDQLQVHCGATLQNLNFELIPT